MTKGNLALQMPSSYVLMDEEEMMYVEGGYVAATGKLSSSQCKKLYYQTKGFCSWYEMSVNIASISTSLLSLACPIAVGVAAVTWLSTTFYKYKYMVNAYNEGALNNGIKILYFSSLKDSIIFS